MHKKSLSLLILLLFSINSKAQDLSTLFQQMGSAYNNSDVIEMDKISKKIKEIAPDNYAGWAYSGFVSILKNDLLNAKKEIKIMNAISPVDGASYGITSYYLFLEGKTLEAQKYMDYSFQLYNPNALDTTLKDVDMIATKTGRNMSGLKTIVKNSASKYINAQKATNAFYSALKDWSEGKNSIHEKTFVNGFKSMQPVNHELLAFGIHLKGIYFYNAKKFNEAKKEIDTFSKNLVIKNSNRAQFAIAQNLLYSSYYDFSSYKWNQVFTKTEKALKTIQLIPKATLMKSDILGQQLQVISKIKNSNKNIVSVAKETLATAKNTGNNYQVINAENALGQYYLNSVIPNQRTKAFNYLKSAHDKATTFGDKTLLSSVNSNYAIALWQSGKKQEAKLLVNTTMNDDILQKKYVDAQLLANNLGFMSFIEKDYTNASTFFKKAVNITENHRKEIKPSARLAMMNEHSSAYGGLIMSYQKTNNIQGLFETQDLNRSRLLRDQLNKKIKPTTLQAVQQQLKPHEALLYYSLAGPGEMIVTVITNTRAKAFYNYPINDWLFIKKQYTNPMQKKPNSINGTLVALDQDIIDNHIVSYTNKDQAFKTKDFDVYVNFTQDLFKNNDAKYDSHLKTVSKHWYNFLLKPIEKEIAEKKTLIISGEKALNYLPFEAFITNENKYLIEKFNVKYIPSATVWTSLASRDYTNKRKSLLAFGGATYQNPKKLESKVRNTESLFNIQNNIEFKISSNKQNLSTELNALGFGGANYLLGTLKEVQQLKKIVTDATIYTDSQMKESDIKRLNISGELANYKYIHLATHGFASDTFPQLSGIMMTQPNNGDGNEDTFLLAHEIANLNLKADIAILSACETALGKIYGGEGVNGLNSALLTAGANSTLLSLWPVNDAGTTVFMTLVYQNLVTYNQSTEDAVCNAKRAMLTNTQNIFFTKPTIWAPFVLSGK